MAKHLHASCVFKWALWGIVATISTTNICTNSGGKADFILQMLFHLKKMLFCNRLIKHLSSCSSWISVCWILAAWNIHMVYLQLLLCTTSLHLSWCRKFQVCNAGIYRQSNLFSNISLNSGRSACVLSSRLWMVWDRGMRKMDGSICYGYTGSRKLQTQTL